MLKVCKGLDVLGSQKRRGKESLKELPRGFKKRKGRAAGEVSLKSIKKRLAKFSNGRKSRSYSRTVRKVGSGVCLSIFEKERIW